ncbi:hypothetical protein GCM10027436_63080 [Actinophytocola sediminis]
MISNAALGMSTMASIRSLMLRTLRPLPLASLTTTPTPSQVNADQTSPGPVLIIAGTIVDFPATVNRTITIRDKKTRRTVH